MQAIALTLLLLLAGCAEFEAKVEEMNKLKCKPADVSECTGWEI